MTAPVRTSRRHERLDAQEALRLLDHAELLELGARAHQKRVELHPDNGVTFVIDRNINYTNICLSGCDFCAFYREPGHPEGYLLTEAVLSRKIEETLDMGGTQILLQGGLNPELKLEDYRKLLRFIKSRFPIHVHGFSPPEILFISRQSGLSVENVLAELMEAGLGSIPGGGAEILADDIRAVISPRKFTAGEWLEVMETAHGLGLKSTATMMFGHIEQNRHIIEHLSKIRELQDRTGGFTAFIPWTFQPGNTRLPGKTASAVMYLRVLALSRLMLDNVPNIQASWVTQGEKVAQAALAFGANDLGSTMIEENVVAAAGVHFRLPLAEMIRLIQDAGYEARQRDCFYNLIRVHGR
ncbi:MAG: cyclic dehypoxanthinyl futalosine synthase [Thermodesulfobacteriota bacterium]